MPMLSMLSELIETRCLVDWVTAPPEDVRARLGTRVVERDGVTTVSVRGVDHLMFNRAVGLGAQRPASVDQVRSVVRHFEEEGVARYFVPLASWAQPTGIAAWLGDAGLVRWHRGWVKLVRGTEPLSDPKTNLEVRPIERADGPALARIVRHCFDLPESAAPMTLALIGRPGWHLSAVHIDGEVAGVGALFVHGDIGALVFGATDPRFRKRGVQHALMVHRIRQALELGCRHIFTETGEAVPDAPQHSYGNMKKCGFRELCTRPNFARPGTTW